MKQFSIRQHIAWLTLMPLLFMVISLETFFLQDRFSALDNELAERGRLITSQLASASEYGVFSNNQVFLHNLAQNVLKQQDVQGVIIVDEVSGILIAAGSFSSASGDKSDNIGTALDKNSSLFRSTENFPVSDNLPMPVYPNSAGLQIYWPIVPAQVVLDESANIGTGITPTGAVVVQMSAGHTGQLKSRLLWGTLVSTLLFLIFPISLIYLASRNIINPLRRLNDVVQQFGEGRLQTRAILPVRVTELTSLSRGFNDMAEKLQREHELLQQHATKLTEAQRIAHLGNWEWDIANNTLGCLKEINRIFGQTSQTTSTTYEAFLQAVHADDRESVNQHFREALEHRRPFSLDHRVLLADGKLCYVHQQAEVSPGDEGKPMMMTGTIQDITERKQAERELRQQKKLIRQVIDTDPNLIFVKDEKGVFLLANQAVADYYGMTISDMIDHSFTHLNSNPQEVEKFVAEDREVILNGRVIVEDQMLMQHGKPHWYHKIKKPLPQEDGSIHILGIAVDITDLKLSEQKLAESYRELQQLSLHLENVRTEERVQIARNLHDEMGAILVALKMRISWLATNLPPETPELQDEVGHLTQLTTDGIQTLRQTVSDLRPNLLDDIGLTAAVGDYAKKFQHNTKIGCTLTMPEESYELTQAQSVTVFRIIQESLNNVAKHALASRVDLHFAVQGESLLLRITDNGIGFEIEPKANSFGMIGIRERALMIGGMATIDSTPGLGTCVSLSIPLAPHNWSI